MKTFHSELKPFAMTAVRRANCARFCLIAVARSSAPLASSKSEVMEKAASERSLR